MLGSRFYIIALLCFSLLMSACTSKEERVEKYFADGLELLEQQNYPKAALAFKNVLQIRPKHAEARFQLGVAEEKQENWRGAFGNYRASVELSKTLIPPRVRLAELFLLAKRIDDASKLADEVVAIDPSHPGGLALRGRISSLNGDNEKALADAEKAVAADPSHIAAVTLLSSLYIQQGKEKEGIAILEKGVNLNPKDITLKLILSKKYAVVKQNDKAEELLQQLIDNEPTLALHRVRMADFQTSINKLEEAEITLRSAVEDNPTNANLKLVLTNFLAKRRGEQAAEETLQEFIKASPQEHQLRFGLAQLYTRQKELDKLKSVYESVIDLDTAAPAKLRAKVQLADVYLNEKDFTKAMVLLEDVLKENPNDEQALFKRGAIAVNQKNIPGAIADFRSILKNQPNSVIALSSLGKVHAMNNELDLAKSNFQKAISITPKNYKLHMELAKVQALLRDKEAALLSIDESLSLKPDELEVLQVKAKILISQKAWQDAEKIAKQIQKSQPSISVGYYYAGLVYGGQKQYNKAASQFKTAIKKSPDDIKPLAELVKMRMLNKDTKTARDELTEYLKKQPDQALAHILLGEVYLADKKVGLAEKTFLKAKEIAPESPQAYRNLARIYMFQKQPEKAVALLESGAESSGKNLNLLLDLAGLHEVGGKDQDAIQVYETVLEKNPGVTQAINNLAMLLIRKNESDDLSKALTLVKRIESIQNPYYQDTIGWVKYKNGDVDGALQHIQVAAKAVPDNAEINYHLGMVYQKRGNSALAKKYLEAALSFKQEFEGKQEAQSVLAAL